MRKARSSAASASQSPGWVREEARESTPETSLRGEQAEGESGVVVAVVAVGNMAWEVGAAVEMEEEETQDAKREEDEEDSSAADRRSKSKLSRESESGVAGATNEVELAEEKA